MKISLNVENRNDYTNKNIERITILSRIEIKYDLCVYQAEEEKKDNCTVLHQSNAFGTYFVN